MNPDTVLKAAQTLARTGDKRAQLGLGLLSIYGYDKLILKVRYGFNSPNASGPVASRLLHYAKNPDTAAAAALQSYFSEDFAKEGFQWIKQLAEDGCNPAPALLAQLLYEKTKYGNKRDDENIGGIAYDGKAALHWAKRAESSQDPLGYLVLGNLHEIGLPGVLPANYSLATTYWNKAAESGVFSAQLALAKHYGYFEWNSPSRDAFLGYKWANIAKGTSLSKWESFLAHLYDQDPLRQSDYIMDELKKPRVGAFEKARMQTPLAESQILLAQKASAAWHARHKTAPAVLYPWEQIICDSAPKSR